MSCHVDTGVDHVEPRFVSRHLEYKDEQGRRGIRVKFYLQGARKRGTAQLDAREVHCRVNG